MRVQHKEWLSLTQASEQLGVHPTTLRRWADAGEVPCMRTPGGHRRFHRSDLDAWIQGQPSAPLIGPQTEAMVQTAVGFTRQEMSSQQVSHQSWYLAFDHESDRQQMRDTGRKLFGLAVQYMGRMRDHEPIMQEGRRIAQFYGQQCAQHQIALADTVRALFFFREALLRAARPGQAIPGQYDDEDVRIHRQLRYFLDEIMYACLSSFEATCRQQLLTEAAL